MQFNYNLLIIYYYILLKFYFDPYGSFFFLLP